MTSAPRALAVQRMLAAGRQQFFGGDLEAAQHTFAAVLKLERQQADALHFQGVIAYLHHHYAEAIRLIRQAGTQRQHDGELYANLGLALQANGEYAAATRAFRRAVTLMPSLAPPRAMLATALRDEGDLDGARAACAEALALDPDSALARFTRAVCGLLDGDLQHVWADHEWRVAVTTGLDYAMDPARPGQRLPRPSTWRHRLTRDSRLLVLAEQGLGDELFFYRYLAPLRAQVGGLGVAPTARMLPLLRNSSAADCWTCPGEQLPEHDFAVLAGDLPLLLPTERLAGAPPSLSLQAEAAELEAMRQRLQRAGPPPYLAVSWRAGPEPVTGSAPPRVKQIPPASLAPALADWPGTLISVQRGLSAEDLSAALPPPANRVADFGDFNADLPAMLALLALCDEHVTVSNTNVHLRAALGRPSHVLVHAPPDWRWGRAGSRSPWFPECPIYRPDDQGDWQAALRTLHRTLLDSHA